MDYNSIRRKTRKIKVGDRTLGGDAPIAVQSMTNTPTADVAATLAQIRALERVGCDIVRVTVPDREAAEALRRIRESGVPVPLVADIHFDHKLAILCAEYGVDKIRINPGNIGEDTKVRAVCEACTKAGVPIRIGVNGGSLEKHILAKHGGPTPEALFESAMYHVRLLERFDFENIVISIKTSNVQDMIEANALLAEATDYPLHLGVTEAGSYERGLVKNAIGIGALLCRGIGDTVRVSLTDDPVAEIGAARQIFGALGLRGQSGMNIISCPTCGRTKIDLIALVRRFEEAARAEGLLDKPIKVALMGCAVNGPGEAREADIGIAGGVGEALLFRHGEIVRKIPEQDVIAVLIEEIRAMEG